MAEPGSSPHPSSLLPSGGGHIPTLDGIRAIAAMFVFVAHAGWSHIVPGGFGVTIFFFLSGYLITTLLRREYEQSGDIHLGHFYLRRALRLFPPLYVVLGIVGGLALAGWIPSDMTWPAVLSQVLYWTNYQYLIDGRDHFVPFTSVFWSLAIEEHFYLFFPLAYIALARRRRRDATAAVLLAACAAALAWRVVVMTVFGADESYTYRATDARFDSLLFGCVLAVWRNPVLGDRPLLRPGQVLPAVVGATLVLLATFLLRDTLFRGTLRYTLQGLALLVLFWVAIRHADHRAMRWLEWPPVRWLGVLSYTFYLSHLSFLYLSERILGPTAPDWLRVPLAFVLTLAFCVVMYRLVERPTARWRRRLATREGAR